MTTSAQTRLEELITWSTPDRTKEDLLAARKAYFGRRGEVFDDDRAVEMRMAGFLEHYVCDRVAPHFGSTPARARYLDALRSESPALAQAWRGLTETVHGLFEVRRLGGGTVRVRGLFSRIDFDVTERRQLVGLKEGDVLECRLLPIDGSWAFSTAWCFHPHQVAKLVQGRARALRSEGGADEAAFVDDCAQRALKVERYRQIAAEKIYDFASKLF